MIKVIQVNGTEKHLYELVAPLVMNPKVLNYNNDYPFKTGEKFIWFIALSDEEVIGFMPMEERGKQWIINNYYINTEAEEKVFKALLKAIGKFKMKDKELTAVVQKQHKNYFSDQHFETIKEWKIYIKMIYTKKKKDEPEQQ